MQRNIEIAKSFLSAYEAIAPVAGVELKDIAMQAFNRPANETELFHFKLLSEAGYFSFEGSGPTGSTLFQLTWKGYSLLEAMRRNESV